MWLQLIAENLRCCRSRGSYFRQWIEIGGAKGVASAVTEDNIITCEERGREGGREGGGERESIGESSPIMFAWLEPLEPLVLESDGVL